MFLEALDPANDIIQMIGICSLDFGEEMTGPLILGNLMSLCLQQPEN